MEEEEGQSKRNETKALSFFSPLLLQILWSGGGGRVRGNKGTEGFYAFVETVPGLSTPKNTGRKLGERQEKNWTQEKEKRKGVARRGRIVTIALDPSSLRHLSLIIIFV